MDATGHSVRSLAFVVLILLVCFSWCDHHTTTSRPNGPTERKFLLLTVNSESDEGGIYHLSLDGERIWQVPLNSYKRPSGVDYDPITGRVYWVSQTKNFWTNHIVSSSLNGSDFKVVYKMDTSQMSKDIALDATEKLLFYCDSGTSTISVLNYDTSHHRIIVHSTHTPSGIQLDTRYKKLYWTDVGMSSIEMSNYDGSERSVVVQLENVRINGMALVIKESLLHWTDAEANTISQADAIKGDNIKEILRSELVQVGNLTEPKHQYKKLVVSSGYIYFTDGIHPGAYRISIDEQHVKMLTNLTYFDDIAIYDADEYYTPDGSDCQSQNGGCSHLCIPTSSGIKCICPDNQRLADDGKTCGTNVTREGPQLIWAEYNGINTAYIYGVHGEPVDYLRLRRFRPWTSSLLSWHWSAIATDYENSQLILVDRYDWLLVVAPLNGQRQMSIIDYGLSNGVDGVAYDWVAGNIYWTDGHFNWIRVKQLKSKWTATIVENLDRPHGIAVHPQEGYMYWTDWGRVPLIERATLSGENRSVIVTKNLNKPTGLAIDYDAYTIYWANMKTVESYNLRTQERRSYGSSYQTQYTNVALYKNYLFAADAGVRLSRNNRTSPLLWFFDTKSSDADQAATRLVRRNIPYGIVMYDQSRQPKQNSACSSMKCAHLCITSPSGGAQCRCADDYTMSLDGSCTGDAHKLGPMLVYALSDRICSVPYKTMHTREVTNTDRYCYFNDSRLQLQFGAVAYDYRAGDIYLAETSRKVKRLYRARLGDMADNALLLQTSNNITDLAVDYIAGNIYWTDAENQAIWVAHTANVTHPKRLAWKINNLYAITVDMVNKRLFYSAKYGKEARIMQANLDGSNARIFLKQNGKFYVSLAVDYDKNRLYFVDRSLGLINHVNLITGKGFRSQYVYHAAEANSVDVIEDFVMFSYVTTTGYGGMRLVNKDTGKAIVPYGILHNNQEKVGKIVAFYRRNQPMVSDAESCAGDFDGDGELDTCQQFCFMGDKGKHKCGCVDGMKISDDGIHCEPLGPIHKDQFLLLNDDYMHRIYQTTEHDLSDAASSSVSTLLIPPLENPLALAYDHKHAEVYWSDYKTALIKASPVASTTDQARLVWSLPYNARVDGLAYDPYSQLLFYTDISRNVIGLMNRYGSQQRILLDEDDGIRSPRAIVLDLKKGWMYFTIRRKGKGGSIMRADMDGGNNIKLVEEAEWPSGLAIDFDSDIMYWCDGSLKKIESASLLGHDRKTVYSGAAVSNPFSMAVTDQYLYWTDWGKRGLYRMSRASSTIKVLRPELFDGLNDVLYYNSSVFPDKTPCSNNNGNCSHICVMVPNGRKCLCPDDKNGAVYVVDGHNCPRNGSCFLQPFPNGKLEDKCTGVIGNECSFSCDLRYRATTDHPVVCQPGGRWSTNLQELCEVNTCPELLLPDNAEVNKDCPLVSVVGNSCLHTCVNGYIRESGDSRRVCTANRRWSGQALVCKKVVCPKLDTPVNAELVSANCPDDASVGQSCLFKCRDGYHQTGGDNERKCQPDQTWWGTAIVCIKAEEVTCPAEISHGKLAKNCERTVGSTCTVICNAGYLLKQTQPLTCMANGAWNIAALDELCYAGFCPKLSLPANARLVTGGPLNRALAGTVHTFECVEGAKLIRGDTILKCAEKLVWIGTPIVCKVGVQTKCARLQLPAYARVTPAACNASSMAIGGKCVFECMADYVRVGGVRERICQQDTTWSGSAIVCQLNNSSPTTSAVSSDEESNKGRLVAAILVPLLILFIALLAGVVYMYRKRKSSPTVYTDGLNGPGDGEVSPSYHQATGKVQLDGSLAFENPVYASTGQAANPTAEDHTYQKMPLEQQHVDLMVPPDNNSNVNGMAFSNPMFPETEKDKNLLLQQGEEVEA